MIGSPRSNVSIISPIRRAERLLCQSQREDLPPAAQWLRDNARALYGQAAQTQQEARYLGRRAFRRLRDFCDALILSLIHISDPRDLLYHRGFRRML